LTNLGLVPTAPEYTEWLFRRIDNVLGSDSLLDVEGIHHLRKPVRHQHSGELPLDHVADPTPSNRATGRKERV
jgi:hypothetical protein